MSEHETYFLKLNLSVFLQYFFVINFLLLFYFIFCILVCKCIQCPQRPEDDVNMEKEWQRVVSHHLDTVNWTRPFWKSSNSFRRVWLMLLTSNPSSVMTNPFRMSLKYVRHKWKESKFKTSYKFILHIQ